MSVFPRAEWAEGTVGSLPVPSCGLRDLGCGEGGGMGTAGVTPWKWRQAHPTAIREPSPPLCLPDIPTSHQLLIAPVKLCISFLKSHLSSEPDVLFFFCQLMTSSLGSYIHLGPIRWVISSAVTERWEAVLSQHAADPPAPAFVPAETKDAPEFSADCNDGSEEAQRQDPVPETWGQMGKKL